MILAGTALRSVGGSDGPTRWVTTCVRGANSSVPKTSGWLLVCDAVWRVCAAKRWRRSPVSAAPTTYASSRVGTPVPPNRWWRHSRELCCSTSRRRNTCIGSRTAAGNRRPQPAGDTVAEGLRQLIDQVPVPVVLGNRYMDVLVANASARALAPAILAGAKPVALGLRRSGRPRFLRPLGRGHRHNSERVSRSRRHRPR